MPINRIPAIDAARGFTVFIMPAVHSVVLYSELTVHQTILGKVLRFLAEGPGAQLFLWLMGLSICLSRTKTYRAIIKRVLYLFALAYVLNYVRLVLPVSLKIMPVSFLHYMAIQDNNTGKLNAFLTGDILQTAAISFLLCAMLFKLKHFQLWAAALILIIIFTPSFWLINISSSPRLFQYLFTGRPPHVFFPVFPWIVYPLAGLITGWLFKKYPLRFLPVIAITGGLLFAAGKIIMLHEPADWNINFYIPGPGAILYHTGIIGMWLVLCHLIVNFLPANIIFRLLKWLSKHITLVYFVQWMVVLWLLPLYGFQQLNLWASVGALALNSLFSFGVAYVVVEFKKRCLVNSPLYLFENKL